MIWMELRLDIEILVFVSETGCTLYSNSIVMQENIVFVPHQTWLLLIIPLK